MKVLRASIIAGLLLGGGLLALPSAAQASTAPADSTPCVNKLISSHEGYTQDADGDTVASQQAAFDIGANLADSDLWVTKDGYIVQMHDNDVSHSTNGTGLVTQMTLAQVQALRTRYHDNPIPQLSDSLAIATAHEPGRYLMFETKFSFEKTANLQNLVNQITAAGMTDHVVIYSAYLDQLKTLKQLDPALTVWFKAIGVPSRAKVAGLDGTMIPAARLTSTVVTRFHAKGLTVIRQRIAETSTSWQTFVDTGADGLMTDSAPAEIAQCRALG